MRTSAQVIDELRAEAPKYWFISLVVGFDRHSEGITPNDADPVGKLEEMIQRGGQAMGFIAFQRTVEGNLQMMSRHLQEWEGEKEWVTKYLAAYAEDMAQELIASGRGRLAESKPWNN